MIVIVFDARYITYKAISDLTEVISKELNLRAIAVGLDDCSERLAFYNLSFLPEVSIRRIHALAKDVISV